MSLRPQPDDPEQSPDLDPTRGSDRREGSPFPVPGTPFTVGDLLARTWSVYKAKWSTCMAVYWGAGAANVVLLLTVDLILSGLNDLARDPTFYDFLRFLHFLAIWVVPAWLWIGQTLAMLKIAHGEPVSLEDLFRGRPYLLTTILASVVFLVVAAVPFLLVQVLTSFAMIRFRGKPARRAADPPERILPQRGHRLPDPGPARSKLAHLAGDRSGRNMPQRGRGLSCPGPIGAVSLCDHRPGRREFCGRTWSPGG